MYSENSSTFSNFLAGTPLRARLQYLDYVWLGFGLSISEQAQIGGIYANF